MSGCSEELPEEFHLDCKRVDGRIIVVIDGMNYSPAELMERLSKYFEKPVNINGRDIASVDELVEWKKELDRELIARIKCEECYLELQDRRDQIQAPLHSNKVKPIRSKAIGPAFNRRLDRRGRNPFRKPQI